MQRQGWWLGASLLLPLVVAACGGGNGGSNPSAAASAPASAAASVASKPATPPTPVPTPTPAEAVYTVKQGDTLSAIASENKSSIDAISKANNLTDADKIQVGQKLIIPASSESPAASTPAASGAVLPPAASKPPPP